MATRSLINIHASGAVKQGEVLFAIDFGEGSVWTYALVDFSGKKVLFGKHSSNNTWAPITTEAIAYSGWLTDEPIKEYIKQLQVYAISQLESVGKAYTIDVAKEIGIYADGKGNISTTPITEKSTEDTLKEIFSGSGSASGSDTGGADTSTPFYKKPVNWLLVVGAVILAYVGYKALKSNDEDED